jgi:hypothetical protein
MSVQHPYTLHYTCRKCGAVYSALRTVSVVQTSFRVFCGGCSNTLHEGEGFYSLSDWELVFQGRGETQGPRKEG